MRIVLLLMSFSETYLKTLFNKNNCVHLVHNICDPDFMASIELKIYEFYSWIL